MSNKEINNYIHKENSKYIECCSILMYFYLKNKHQRINIDDVAKEIGGNLEENKRIIRQILKGFRISIIFDTFSLSFCDYIKLQDIVQKHKTYYFQLFPFIISVIALVISMESFLLATIVDPTEFIVKFSAVLIMFLIFYGCYYIHKITKY